MFRNNDTTIILLCGGFGTRMKILTKKYKCKSLIPINNRPILYYTLSWIKPLSIKNIFLCTNRKEIIDDLKEVAETVGLKNYEIYQDSGGGMAPIIFSLRKKLGKKTIIICGNQPTPTETILSFINTKREVLIGLYRTTSDQPTMIARVTPESRKKEIKILKLSERNTKKLYSNEFFISRPYSIDCSLYQKTEKIEGRGEYILRKWVQTSKKVYGSILSLPYEIHYEEDIDQLKKFLEKNF